MTLLDSPRTDTQLNASQTDASPTGAPPTPYAGYKGLPPLVGLHTMEGSMSVGLTVEESVARLKRFHWAMRRLHQIFIARLTAMPVYELKMAFSLHAHYCAEHIAGFRTRVREMRQPPYGLDEAPDAHFEALFDEILAAPTTETLVFGLYAKAVPALTAAMRKAVADVNRLFDHPTYRVCRLALVELEDIDVYGKQAVACLIDEGEANNLAAWAAALDALLAAAGTLDGTGETSDKAIAPAYAGKPFVYDGRPQRDDRFVDSYNMGVNAEALLLNPAIDPLPKTIMLYFKRMREIDVPEMMASIISETKDKPWEYYRDMTRQLWDEARHAMMGEVGFVSMGIDWKKIPFNFTWSLNLNTMLTPLQRHAVLFTIEQGLMPKKTGKEYEWEVAVATANRLTQLIQDYDWADEILHARIGRDWLVPEFGSQMKALEAGNEYWSKTLTEWAKWRDDGLTRHENWWPDVYRRACAHWGVEPNADLLAYSETYEHSRADRKEV